MTAIPARFESITALEDFMTEPTPALVDEFSRLDGDLIVLGVGGKMGPTLARMAKRAAPGKRVIGVARFSDRELPRKLEAQGIECLSCDLLDRAALERLPNARDGVTNVMFMAGHKFGATGNSSLTWAMNVGVPFMVAETFREARIVAFSTACVYPYADVKGAGAVESTPATPPAGDYANSCVGRERMFEFGSRKYGTPGRMARLSYAIDMRYGVLFDVASAVFTGMPIDVTMGHVNVIWQGDANEQILRLLTRCTAPATPINITGPKLSTRWLAGEFGKRLRKPPVLTGTEAATAWLIDTAQSRQLFGAPAIGIDTMIDWVSDWVARGQPSLGKATHFSTRDGTY
jgi:nucleoside-diphosphate-sugar epimerase